MQPIGYFNSIEYENLLKHFPYYEATLVFEEKYGREVIQFYLAPRKRWGPITKEGRGHE